jgi:hypothetical protein
MYTCHRKTLSLQQEQSVYINRVSYVSPTNILKKEK